MRKTKNFRSTLLLVSIVVFIIILISCDKKVFEIKFMDGEVLLKTQLVKKADEISPPTDLLKDKHRFIGWDKDFSVIDNDMIIYAIWEEEIEDDELDLYTKLKIIELKNYIIDKESIYSLNNWKIILDYIETFSIEVFLVDTIGEVSILFLEYKSKINEVVTFVEELKQYKKLIIDELIIYIEKINIQDYNIENWSIILNYLDEYKNYIENEETIDKIDILVIEFKNKINEVKTLVMQLENYRISIKNELDDYIFEKGESNYSTENWSIILNYLNEYKNYIDNEETIDKIDILLTEFYSKIDEVEYFIVQFRKYCINVKGELSNYVLNKGVLNYSIDSWEIIYNYLVDYNNNIDEKETIQEIDLLIIEFKNLVDEVDKIDTSHMNLNDYKDWVKNKLVHYTFLKGEENYYSHDLGTIRVSLGSVQISIDSSATISKEQIELLGNEYIDFIEGIEIPSYKQLLMYNLERLYSFILKYKYYKNEHDIILEMLYDTLYSMEYIDDKYILDSMVANFKYEVSFIKTSDGIVNKEVFLSETQKKIILHDYIEQYDSTPIIINPEYIYIAEYLIFENGVVAVSTTQDEYLMASMQTKVIAGVTFYFYSIYIKIWHENIIYELEEAYDLGLLTVDELQTIANARFRMPNYLWHQ